MSEQRSLADILTRLVAANPTPFAVAYHPDADPGDGSGWSVEYGDRHAYGHIDEALAAAGVVLPAEVPHA